DGTVAGHEEIVGRLRRRGGAGHEDRLHVGIDVVVLAGLAVVGPAVLGDRHADLAGRVVDGVGAGTAGQAVTAVLQELLDEDVVAVLAALAVVAVAAVEAVV